MPGGKRWCNQQSPCNFCKIRRENPGTKLPMHELRRCEDGVYSLRPTPRRNWQEIVNGRREVVSPPLIEETAPQASVKSAPVKNSICQPKVATHPEVQAKLPSRNTHPRSPVQNAEGQYSFGNVFCGAGGISRGAEMAGLQLKWALDSDEEAIKALRKNFSTTQTNGVLQDFREFTRRLPSSKRRFAAEIVHFSPPCQPYSSRTSETASWNPINMERRACSGAIKPMLEMLQPRIATLETVPNILIERHKGSFHEIFDAFTSSGYTVRRKVIHFVGLGLPQPRKRLFLIATR